MSWVRAARISWLAAAALLLTVAPAARAVDKVWPASAKAAEIDGQIDWSRARLIAVQDGGRYKTLDSFAREAMQAMYGKESFPGLSPMASIMEWLFNREAYIDVPVIRVKEKGLRLDITSTFTVDKRQRIVETQYMTPREFAHPDVRQRIRELEPRATMATAIRRARNAEFVAFFADQMLRIVPPATTDPDDLWHTVDELQVNLPAEALAAAGLSRTALLERFGGPVVGISERQALAVCGAWASARAAWRSGDAEGFQSAIDRLAGLLPELAREGVYPSHSQRAAEARYYAMGKFTFGWVIYFLGMLAGIWAFASGWRVPWWVGMALLAAALGFHAYGLGLRWYIQGRIPVANMFEAVVASAWMGIALAFVAEIFYRRSFFLVGAHATGFMALILASFVIPGGGTLQSLMGILDDVMLRIHTVLIIASYALIFLASVIALLYLFGYYLHTMPRQSGVAGLTAAFAGAVLLGLTLWAFEPASGPVAAGVVKRAGVGWAFGGSAIGLAGLLTVLVVLRKWTFELFVAAVALVACTTLAIGNHAFAGGMAKVLLGGGLLWSILTAVGMRWRPSAAGELVGEPAGRSVPGFALAGATAGGREAADLRLARPILAGGAPGDEHRGRSLPEWLYQADWAHLIILNMVFVLLFIGVVLGAVWADYSWGRPWGWDPKEVFALNTWIIYAILIHVRFITKQRGLWTAWLSVAGCLMMAFNWCFVNFFIVGLHSYA